MERLGWDKLLLPCLLLTLPGYAVFSLRSIFAAFNEYTRCSDAIAPSINHAAMIMLDVYPL